MFKPVSRPFSGIFATASISPTSPNCDQKYWRFGGVCADYLPAPERARIFACHLFPDSSSSYCCCCPSFHLSSSKIEPPPDPSLEIVSWSIDATRGSRSVVVGAAARRRFANISSYVSVVDAIRDTACRILIATVTVTRHWWTDDGGTTIDMRRRRSGESTIERGIA